MSLILMTRAIDDSMKSKEILEGLGFCVFTEPMFRVHYPTVVMEKLDRYDMVVATSRHGIIGMAKSTNERNMHVLTVGNRTMECAIDLGFINVDTVNGTVLNLLDYLNFNARGRRVLYIRGRNISHDLKKSAEELNVTVEESITYETVASTAISPECGYLFTSGRVSGVLFYSKGTAEIFMKLVEKEYSEFLDVVSAYTISREAQEVLNACRWKRVCISEQPTEESLFKLLCDLSDSKTRG
ncbi:MAG: uroporphyrinogen-III synthase [Aaplasma endosymbiont of Hyalomma asiaticum]